ncbi:TetR/AcrR family transcriptional regulator [Shewanella sp. KX20019]|uniref:TetR/AcrR family transcriptional regulator n=1 Tax=Shewanella sp. KX20019 TaxID=2803864 RepID=UPI0019264B29|nr:TetR/AcrR family transcriptional regulator [Shewanella sp. KX20019]QQX80470.1 TetR/AcrR family transcriptional regulator [Shewanella sp. KX20019]
MYTVVKQLKLLMNNYLLNPTQVISTILDEAKEVIREQGLCSFKLSTIAERSNCSTKTLYSRFRSKEDIVVALFIQHVNDIIEKINTISSDDSLSNKEKIIYSLMYDPMKCWTAEKNDMCVNFLGVNRHIYNNVSPEFEGNLQVIFLEIKEHTQAMWRNAIDDGELHSNKDEILKCIVQLRAIQKGAVVIGQNKYLRQFGYDTDAKPIFEALCSVLNGLDWSERCEAVSYGNMLKTITPLLDENHNINQQHYDIPMESLKDPIEL